MECDVLLYQCLPTYLRGGSAGQLLGSPNCEGCNRIIVASKLGFQRRISPNNIIRISGKRSQKFLPALLEAEHVVLRGCTLLACPERRHFQGWPCSKGLSAFASKNKEVRFHQWCTASYKYGKDSQKINKNADFNMLRYKTNAYRQTYERYIIYIS